MSGTWLTLFTMLVTLGTSSCTMDDSVDPSSDAHGGLSPFATADATQRTRFQTEPNPGAQEPDTHTPARRPTREVEPREEPDAGEEPYECEPFSEEECQTPCGTWGIRKCIKIWTDCIPPDEVCNLKDDDCDGEIDEGVSNACGGCGAVPFEECNGLDDDCDGIVDEDVTNACGECGPEPVEVCNGIDDDCDGMVDEEVTNACGSCGPEPVEVCNGMDDDCDGMVDEGVTNACGQCGNDAQELCNGIDDNCNGQIDEQCVCNFNLNINGDCVFVQCPPQCPYPVSCNLNMVGGDPRGCVASQPNVPLIYLQEGDNCGAGFIAGTLTCSSVPGPPLNQGNCPINKPQPIHTNHPFGCPDT